MQPNTARHLTEFELEREAVVGVSTGESLERILELLEEVSLKVTLRLERELEQAKAEHEEIGRILAEIAERQRDIDRRLDNLAPR